MIFIYMGRTIIALVALVLVLAAVFAWINAHTAEDGQLVDQLARAHIDPMSDNSDAWWKTTTVYGRIIGNYSRLRFAERGFGIQKNNA